MADISEAYNTLKTQKNHFCQLDYFFTQRTLMEEQEYIDKNMNRRTKKVKLTYNFLALNIPTIITTNNGNSIETSLGFDIEIYGDEGYHYKGTISSHQGIIPNFMIPLKCDKKLFVNVNYNFTSNQENKIKKYINFIDVPKRFQNTIEDDVLSKDGDNDREDL